MKAIFALLLLVFLACVPDVMAETPYQQQLQEYRAQRSQDPAFVELEASFRRDEAVLREVQKDLDFNDRMRSRFEESSRQIRLHRAFIQDMADRPGVYVSRAALGQLDKRIAAAEKDRQRLAETCAGFDAASEALGSFCDRELAAMEDLLATLRDIRSEHAKSAGHGNIAP